MSDLNFHRTYVLKAGVEGQEGITIGNTDDATQKTLRITFDIEKGDSKSANTGSIKIYNLSDESQRLLEQTNVIVELSAGYNMTMPLVLVGAVSEISTSREDADIVTELEVADGLIALRDKYITISRVGTVQSKEICDLIAQTMGVTVVYAQELVFKEIPDGFSFVGKARDALTKITNYNGFTWSMQNQVLQIHYAGRPLDTRGYLLSPSTGLVDIPKKVKITGSSSSTSSTDKGQTGYEVKYLMNAAIGVNDYIELDSKYVNGYFVVKKVKISGDNRQGDWICTAQVLKTADLPTNATGT
jgi:hypothetical protein